MKRQKLGIVALLLFTQISAGSFIQNYNGRWSDAAVISLVIGVACATLFIHKMVNLKDHQHS